MHLTNEHLVDACELQEQELSMSLKDCSSKSNNKTPFSEGNNGRSVKLTSHLHSVSHLRSYAVT
jgi:hypothetical protein